MSDCQPIFIQGVEDESCCSREQVGPHDEYVKNLPFKLDAPRLIYRIPDKLNKFYGEDRVAYYNREELIEFYRKVGQIPVKRVK